MTATQSSPAAGNRLGARRSMAALLLILLAAGLCSALRAVAKPFWYDEMCTVILCRLPSMAEIWKALNEAADTNPPVFYVISRWSRQLILDDHLGYRLPSILGLLGTISCLYVFLSRRVNHVSALVGAAFVLCTPLAAYAYEARPYALMVGCVSGAILVWQRIDDSRLYSFVLFFALAGAVSLHYYAILVWPVFVIAEASVLLFHRRFRVGIWIALLAGAVPLLFFAHLLMKLRQYYGQNFWAAPGIKQVFSVYNWLFNFGGHWGLAFAAGVTVMFIYGSFTKTAEAGFPGSWQSEEGALPPEECVLTLLLLWFPAIAVAAAIAGHGGMTDRYMLPTILGGAIAVGYLASKVSNAVRVLLLILLLMNYGLSSVSDVKKVVTGSLLERRAAAAREVKALLTEQPESDLPIVISQGLEYLPMAYYTPVDSNRKLFAITDPHAAVQFQGTDSVDLALLVLRRYFPLQVEDFDGFASRHREFLLVSVNDGGFEWWPARLLHDGHTLRLLSLAGNTHVYKVTLRP